MPSRPTALSKIIVDTREQLPLWVRGIIRKKLNVGDYSTQRLQHTFCIERKSGADLYGSIIQGHVRFMNELIRAKTIGVELVIYVECCKKDFVNLKFRDGKNRKMDPLKLEKIINTIIKRKAIEVVWCKSRDVLKRKILQRLKQEEL